MVKRLAILFFCAGLMAFWSTDAKAWPASSSGWYVKSSSIIVNSSWVQISNTDVKPTSIVASINPMVVVYYRNPGGGEGGDGVPFTLEVLVGLDQLNPLVGRGKADSEIYFPSIDFDYLVRVYGLPYLNSFAPNPNWTAYDAKLTGLDVKIQAYADVSDFCDTSNTPTVPPYTSCFYNSAYSLFEEEVVHMEGLCSTPDNGATFNCVESEHWEYSKKDPFWP